MKVRPVRVGDRSNPGSSSIRAVLCFFALALSIAASIGAPPAHAQAPSSFGDAVASWARGAWASPVYCRIGGETVRGIRRVLIQPSKNVSRGQTVLEVQFVDMKVDDAERCFDLVGQEIPNLTGKLQLRFTRTGHPETVQQDFERALKRDRGFEFDISNGVLQVQHVGPETQEPERTSFREGHAWIRQPARSSDSERALADFDSPRKLELEVSAPDAAPYRLPLFLLEIR